MILLKILQRYRCRRLCQLTRLQVVSLQFALFATVFLLSCAMILLVLDEKRPKGVIQKCSEEQKCHRDAQCFQTASFYVCKCNEGFFGDGFYCKDVDECKQGADACKENEQCHNTVGSYRCQCKEGFTRDQRKVKCVDINECEDELTLCDEHAFCQNTIGSYTCTCATAYSGNGKYCRFNPDGCVVPQNPGFPDCAKKVKWLSHFWHSHPCYKRLGVDGSICSFLVYLSEIENECPIMTGSRRKRANITRKVFKQENQKNYAESERYDNDVLLNQIIYEKNNFDWVRKRIGLIWNDWVTAFKSLKTKKNLEKRQRKNVLIFIGILIDRKWGWAANAKKGGPLGEMVQWADLIASIYLLGHNLHIASKTEDLREDGHPSPRHDRKFYPCGDRKVAVKDYDVIYIDIHGIHMLKQQRIDVNKLKCKFRVLDSFGTEARFNFLGPIDDSVVTLNGDKKLAQELSTDTYGYANLKVQLKQIMTMFPHSPDNTFLGFVVGRDVHKNISMDAKENTGLVYGKQNYMFEGMSTYLSMMSSFVKLHGTVLPDNTQSANENSLRNVPSFIENHGLMAWKELQSLLRKTKIFIGLGFPFEGVAPLEGISNGAVFINPKWDPPLSRLRDKEFDKKYFFEGKPTLRKFTSQHPYMEEFVGKPYVYTINVNNNNEVENTIKEILENFKTGKINPYLPFEFTNEGMLQRVNAFIENQDFCDESSSWPDVKFLIRIKSNDGESCKDACVREGLLCENSFFKFLNTKEEFDESGVTCSRYERKNSLLAPSIHLPDMICTLQKEQLLFSCVDAATQYERLCPCRKYIFGQSALWPDEISNS